MKATKFTEPYTTGRMTNRSIAVIVDFDSSRKGPGGLPAFASAYITEILNHAGVPYDLLEEGALKWNLSNYTVLILSQDSRFTPDQNEGLVKFVEAGGTVIGTAGTCNLDSLFGVETMGLTMQGYLQPSMDSHPITEVLKRELHVFGGSRVRSTSGKTLAMIEYEQGVEFDGVIENRVRHGLTVLFAFDLVTTVAHLQMGTHVVPPSTNEITNRRLEYPASNATVLDKDRDRDMIEAKNHDDLYYPTSDIGPDGLVKYNQNIFLEPMADILKGMLLRAIFHAHVKAGRSLPVLWYWPRGLQSIAHMSHDSDGQLVSKAWTLYRVLEDLGIQTTWCTMPVEGWTREFFDALKGYGHEIALHYAFGRSPVRTDHRWSQTDFNWQVDWLCYIAQIPRIFSNKNHGLAMNGRLEFYKWCEAKGLQVDQTHGDKGFTFGTSHPFFPMEDGKPGGSFIDVMALPFLTQDLTVVCPMAFMKPLVDKCHNSYGVAHFLFHPTHIEDPGNKSAIRQTVAYTQSLGMEWWKSDDISLWERARRCVTLTAISSDVHYELNAPKPLNDATLMFLQTNESASNHGIIVDNEFLDARTVERYGHRFTEVDIGLNGSHEIRLLANMVQ